MELSEKINFIIFFYKVYNNKYLDVLKHSYIQRELIICLQEVFIIYKWKQIINQSYIYLFIFLCFYCLW